MSRVPAGITACRAATLSPKLSEDSFITRCRPSRSVTIHRVASPTISIDDRFARTRAYLARLSVPVLEKKSAKPEWRWLAYSSMDMEGSLGAVKFIRNSYVGRIFVVEDKFIRVSVAKGSSQTASTP